MKSNVKTAKIRMEWRERRKMYGSAGNEAWMQKFKEKEEIISGKIEELKELVLKDSKFEELLLAKEEELKNHKEYVFQFLVNIG